MVPWHRPPPLRDEARTGVEVAVLELSQALAEAGVSVDLLVPPSQFASKIDSRSERLTQKFGVVESELGRKFLEGRTADSKEKSFLNEYDYLLSAHLCGVKLLSGLNIETKIVRQIHTVFQAIPLKYGLQLRSNPLESLRNLRTMRQWRRLETLLRGTRGVCVSREAMNLLVERGLEIEENLSVIPIGVDVEKFRPLKAEKPYDLLFIGNFFYVKGADLLLNALNRLSNSGHTLNVAVVGGFSPSQRRWMMQRLHGTPIKLDFKGMLPHYEMPLIINSSRFLVIPSRYESFSMVALEGMACGVPVIATNVGALPELVDDSVGRLVKPNGESIATALKETVNNGFLTESALINGPERAENYDLPKIAKRFIRLLRDEI